MSNSTNFFTIIISTLSNIPSPVVRISTVVPFVVAVQHAPLLRLADVFDVAKQPALLDGFTQPRVVSHLAVVNHHLVARGYERKTTKSDVVHGLNQQYQRYQIAREHVPSYRVHVWSERYQVIHAPTTLKCVMSFRSIIAVRISVPPCEDIDAVVYCHN